MSEPPLEEELLGSVTTLSSPAVRTSARVIQKMKMDSIRPPSPPLLDKKDSSKDDRASQKTPVQTKPSKVIWTNIERNLFFDAINEYGKDFEAISHYVNLKQKRKSTVDPTYKTKDHVRLLYYQTFHKVTKYLRFSEDIKKHAQELYALINYGEMRKKLIFINQKACMKLKELVYKGSVTVRVKGKNIRIKTPSCKALRKLNQLEEWQEEIKLPSKVDVFLKPANTEAWARVQSLAQNPRVKTILPLQKRVLSLLKTLQTRWRSREVRLCDQTMTMASNITIPAQKHSITDVKHLPDTDILQCVQEQEPILCFAPQSNIVIHRPMVNLAEFLSSYSICLNSYEDRIGVSVKGEKLCSDRLNSLKDIIRNSKRQRQDSGSDKKSPEYKRPKVEPSEKKTDIASLEKDKTIDITGERKYENDYLKLLNSNTFEIDGITFMESSADESECKEDFINTSEPMSVEYSSVIDSFESIHLIKKENNGSLAMPDNGIEVPDVRTDTIDTNKEPAIIEFTMRIDKTEQKNKKKDTKSQAHRKREANKKEPFRPLLNEEIVKEIKKGWSLLDVGDLTIGDLYIMFGQDFKVNLEYSWIEQKKEELSDDGLTLNEKLAVSTRSNLGNKLKQLLVLANMTEKSKKKNNCTCGHICDRGKVKNKDEVFPRSFISNKIYPSSHNDNGLFRQPVLPLRSGVSHVDAYRLNLNHSRNKQTRWIKARTSRPSKQVVVQRFLPLQPGIAHSYDVVANTQVDYTKHSMMTNELSKFKLQQSHDITDNVTAASVSNNNNERVADVRKSDTVPQTSIQIKTVENRDKTIATEYVSNNGNIHNDSSEDSIEGIHSLMDLSLPSPARTPPGNIDEYFSYGCNPAMSPMSMLRQSPTDPKWFEDNVNDFSLSSFLGHLDSACDLEKKSRSSNEDLESSNLSTISETSIDYMSKFEELAQSMINQEKRN